eukprot:TRINITY_DN5198_c0_g1_i2.p1 TRINITY_DN5198_c0_g1~~TRINITY_DN5198_c0_g1_i2.p1  ORF type:complete len:1050 (+),score=334.14 TRINITY_DN5198_c0_g1_i2:62-3151(+)
MLAMMRPAAGAGARRRSHEAPPGGAPTPTVDRSANTPDGSTPQVPSPIRWAILHHGAPTPTETEPVVRSAQVTPHEPYATSASGDHFEFPPQRNTGRRGSTDTTRSERFPKAFPGKTLETPLQPNAATGVSFEQSTQRRDTPPDAALPDSNNMDMLSAHMRTPPGHVQAPLSGITDEGISTMDGQVSTEPHKMEKKVSVKPLSSLVVEDVMRTSALVASPAFIAFLIIFTTDCMCSYNPDDAGGVRHLQHAVAEEVMHLNVFDSVVTAKDFYQWISLVATNLFDQTGDVKGGVAASLVFDELVTNPNEFFLMGPGAIRGYGGVGGLGHGGRVNYALHYLILRQHRAQSTACQSDQYRHLSADLLERIREVGCIGEYRRDRLNGTRYQTAPPSIDTFIPIITDPFAPDLEKAQMPPLRRLHGRLRRYKGCSEQFTILLPYKSLELPQVKLIVDSLAAAGWIDAATQMVSLSALFLNPVLGVYTATDMVVEFSQSGSTFIRASIRPFWLFLSSDRRLHTALQVLDALSTVYLLFLILDLARDVSVRRRVHNSPLGPWELVRVVHFLVLFAALTARFLLFKSAASIEDDLPAHLLYEEMVEYVHFFDITRMLMLGCLWCTWGRCLEFLRYHKQLNAVTETVRIGAHDLTSIICILFVLTMGFALVGQMNFGWHIEEFETLGNTFRWLFLILFTADINQNDVADRMTELSPVLAPAYLACYVMLSWLLLLNVVLGILATAFAAAAATTEDFRWSASALLSDLAAMWRCRTGFYIEGDEVPAVMRRPCTAWDQLLWLGRGRAERSARFVSSARSLAAFADEFQRGLEPVAGFSDLVAVESVEKGWSLTALETDRLLRMVETRNPESFADAEDMRQQEVQENLKAIRKCHAETRALRRHLDHVIDALMNRVRQELEGVSTKVTDQVRQAEEAVVHAERRLSNDVTVARTDLRGGIDGTQMAVSRFGGSLRDDLLQSIHARRTGRQLSARSDPPSRRGGVPQDDGDGRRRRFRSFSAGADYQRRASTPIGRRPSWR